MKSALYKTTFILLLIVFLLFTIKKTSATAGCSISISPSSIKGGVVTAVNFRILNLSEEEPISAVFISTTAVDEFQIQSASSAGWSSSIISSNNASFINGTLSPGSTQEFSLNLLTIDQDQPSITWDITAGQSEDASDAVVCTGSSGVAIYKSTSVSGVSLSNIGASDITTTRAKITWTTDASANSVVEYGKTSSYGSTKTDSSQVTSHSVTTDSLEANTTYHYRVKSADSLGNTATSGDFTFTTASETSVITATLAPTSTPTPIPTPVPDRLPPIVTIEGEFSKPYAKAPVFKGTVTDNKGVENVEYTVDGGKSWIKVDDLEGVRTTKATYAFLPPDDLDDNNYQLQVRALDINGNTGRTGVHTLIIDRLPPQVGPQILKVKSMYLEPDRYGVYTLSKNMQGQLIFSTIGGVTEIKLEARSAKSETNSKAQIFKAEKNQNNGLWSANFSFNEVGFYLVRADAEDGAKNKAGRVIARINVVDEGRIDGLDNGQVELTIYTQNRDTKEFIPWNAKPYDQTNPVVLRAESPYSLILPSGIYFFKLSTWGYKTIQTSIFKIDTPTPITSDMTMHKAQGIGIGPLRIHFFDFLEKETVDLDLRQKQPHQEGLAKELEGKQIPPFRFGEGKKTVSNLTMRGKPTDLVFLSTWSAYAPQQLAYLDELNNENVGIHVIAPHESSLHTELFQKRGRYKFPVLSDTKGESVRALQIETTPVHIFINNAGTVTHVKTGVLTPDEVRQYLLD